LHILKLTPYGVPIGGADMFGAVTGCELKLCNKKDISVKYKDRYMCLSQKQ